MRLVGKMERQNQAEMAGKHEPAYKDLAFLFCFVFFLSSFLGGAPEIP